MVNFSRGVEGDNLFLWLIFFHFIISVLLNSLSYLLTKKYCFVLVQFSFLHTLHLWSVIAHLRVACPTLLFLFLSISLFSLTFSSLVYITKY